MSTDQHGAVGNIALEVLVTEENEIYVKFSGFENEGDADKYAEYLSENLSLMLFESKVMH
mgnify:CR=1 FL=1